jgi:hypothetical protein
MNRLVVPGIAALLIAGSASAQDATRPSQHEAARAETDTRYLAFQIFTYSPDPRAAVSGSGKETPGLPGDAALRDTIQEIKQQIGTVAARAAHASRGSDSVRWSGVTHCPRRG